MTSSCSYVHASSALTSSSLPAVSSTPDYAITADPYLLSTSNMTLSDGSLAPCVPLSPSFPVAVSTIKLPSPRFLGSHILEIARRCYVISALSLAKLPNIIGCVSVRYSLGQTALRKITISVLLIPLSNASAQGVQETLQKGQIPKGTIQFIPFYYDASLSKRPPIHFGLKTLTSFVDAPVPYHNLL